MTNRDNANFNYEQRFWMIYKQGDHNPAVCHSTRQEAEKEAERICQKHHTPIIVLEAIAIVKPIEQPMIKWSQLPLGFSTIPTTRNTDHNPTNHI